MTDTNAAAHDAVLTDWTLARHRTGVCIIGLISKDAKKRFRDDIRIRTSPIAAPSADPCEGMVVQTDNTRYLLKAPATSLTGHTLQIIQVFGLTAIDPVIARQLRAVDVLDGYANLIDNATINAASIPEVMLTGDDTDHEAADILLHFALGQMEAARDILPSDMLAAAIEEARQALSAPTADRDRTRPFIHERIMPLIEKLECLARAGEDADAIRRANRG